MESLTPNEREMLEKLHQGENECYAAGLNHEPLTMFPDLAVETTEEKKGRMIDKLVLKQCFKTGIDMDNPDFDNFYRVLYLFAELLALSYCDGLKESKKRNIITAN